MWSNKQNWEWFWELYLWCPNTFKRKTSPSSRRKCCIQVQLPFKLGDSHSPPTCPYQQKALPSSMGPKVSTSLPAGVSRSLLQSPGLWNTESMYYTIDKSALLRWTHKKEVKQEAKFLHWNADRHCWPSNTLVQTPLLWNNGIVWTCAFGFLHAHSDIDDFLFLQ